MTYSTSSRTTDAGTERHHWLGAFARIYVRDSAEALAEAFMADQLVQVQLNLSALGLPTIPTAQQLADLDIAAVKAAFTSRGGVIWGVSATYNTAHPDPGVREDTTAKAAYFSDAEQFGVQEVRLDTLPDGHVRLRVLASGVCGTDAHIHRGAFGVRFPMTPGHEFIAEVVEANVEGDSLSSSNDRVAVDNGITRGSCPMCRDGRPGLCANLRAYGLTHAGGAAQFVDVPAAVSVSVGDLAIETAVLAEPTACVVHGLDVLPAQGRV